MSVLFILIEGYLQVRVRVLIQIVACLNSSSHKQRGAVYHLLLKCSVVLFLIDMHIHSIISMRRDYRESIISIARRFEEKRREEEKKWQLLALNCVGQWSCAINSVYCPMMLHHFLMKNM
jgi:hypothetical protein